MAEADVGDAGVGCEGERGRSHAVRQPLAENDQVVILPAQRVEHQFLSPRERCLDRLTVEVGHEVEVVLARREMLRGETFLELVDRGRWGTARSASPTAHVNHIRPQEGAVGLSNHGHLALEGRPATVPILTRVPNPRRHEIDGRQAVGVPNLHAAERSAE